MKFTFNELAQKLKRGLGKKKIPRRVNCVRQVSYTGRHRDIVRNGIAAIREVLTGPDPDDKESLLLCLDMYLDPYYGYNLPYENDIYVLLQEQLFGNDPKEIKDEILSLLALYSPMKLEILAENIEALDPGLRERAEEILSWD